jgi:small subunit ribosomal protein S9
MGINKILSFGTGRRKCSFCEVILFPGTGVYFINLKLNNFYFQNNNDQNIQSFFPLKILNLYQELNGIIRVRGGGLETQTKAISLAIARALVKMFPFIKKTLKRLKLLNYDPRIIERKKYNLKKARKKSQHSKR